MLCCGHKDRLIYTKLLWMNRLKLKNPLLNIIRGALIDLPSPSNIRYFWNFGSLLGFSLLVQILRGLLLAIIFSADIRVSFDRVSRIMRDVNSGWLIRIIHANGARIFFFFLYLHVARGMYYMSYHYIEVWNLGVVILLIVMAIAFLGYVLPWGQISFWGASVITGLFSAIPVIGNELVVWLWGDFAVYNPTLVIFFSLHFLLPFVVSGLVILHLLFLHETGSRNPLGVRMRRDKISFHPYFTIKDLAGVFAALFFLLYIVCYYPWTLGDPENFISANPLVTPIHIQPEWYFLFAYAILRSIPNKLGGVLALAGSVLILFVIPVYTSTKFRGLRFYLVTKRYFWYWCARILLLTWIGACPVEEPYIRTGQFLSIFYFRYYCFVFWSQVFWDRMLN